MKKKETIIDLEVVKDWNWVKCKIRGGYYFIRNKWWGVTSFCRRLFSLDRFHGLSGYILLGYALIASILVAIFMGVYLSYVIFGVEFTIFCLIFVLINIWLDTKLPSYRYHKKYKEYDKYYGKKFYD